MNGMIYLAISFLLCISFHALFCFSAIDQWTRVALFRDSTEDDCEPSPDIERSSENEIRHRHYSR